MAECYNTACPYCMDYQCKRTATCDMRLDGEYVKVKHGRWVDVEPALWGQVYETCSECGTRQALDKGKDKFCGVCGAKMDERESEE